jgi:hypothetical protein
MVFGYSRSVTYCSLVCQRRTTPCCCDGTRELTALHHISSVSTRTLLVRREHGARCTDHTRLSACSRMIVATEGGARCTDHPASLGMHTMVLRPEDGARGT